MNKQAQAGGVFILLALMFFLLLFTTIWINSADLLANMYQTTIDDTAGTVHGETLEFLIRIFPWAVPIIVVLALLAGALFR